MPQKRKAREESLPQVYVSCSPRDSKEAESIVYRLEREGIQTWFDRRDIVAGERVRDRRLEVRAASKIWLVFIGAGGSERIQAQDYAEAQARLQRAPSGSFRLVPLLLRGVAWEDAPTFLRPFSGFQIHELERESEWRRLVEGLKKALSGVADRTPRVQSRAAGPGGIRARKRKARDQGPPGSASGSKAEVTHVFPRRSSATPGWPGPGGRRGLLHWRGILVGQRKDLRLAAGHAVVDSIAFPVPAAG